MAKKKTQSGTHWFKTTLCVLVACAIVGTVISAVMFSAEPGQTYASASIEFSFDGAASGLAPNGYRFNVRDMISDTVLNRAIESAGMAGRYTAEQIRDQVRILGDFPDDIVDQMLDYESLLDFDAGRSLSVNVYHPTQYTVQLHNGFDTKISKSDLELLLDNILASYRTYFSETSAVIPYETAIGYSLDEYDYPQQLTIISRLLSDSAEFAAEMFEKDPSLTVHGIGDFNNIAVRLNALNSNEVNRLKAAVTINALTKRPERLILQYQYEIHDMESQKKYRTEQLASLKSLIKIYEEQKSDVLYLATTDSVTKIDGNSSETYDRLMAARKTVEEQITTIEAEMEDYQLMLDDLKGAGEKAAETEVTENAVETVEETGTESAEETVTVSDVTEISVTQEEVDAANAAKEELNRKLDADIAALVSEREKIMNDFATLIKAYNDQEINDQTVAVSNYDYKSPKLLSGAFIKQTLKVAGPICAVGFIVCLVLIIISRKKEEKAAMV